MLAMKIRLIFSFSAEVSLDEDMSLSSLDIYAL